MAGINAIAGSATHAASGVDVAVSGFVTGETIALTAAPTGTDYQWALSAPSGSNALRVGLAGTDEAAAAFTPDVAGLYAVSVVVDGTTYILRLSVTQLVQSYALEALRFSPVADSQVPTPATGVALYFSSTQGALTIKDTSGDTHTVTVS
jgi:hypothetical protein